MASSPDAGPPVISGLVWRFGRCVYDERRRLLTVDGRQVDVEGKPLDVLAYLLAHAGEAVTKDELLAAAWPGLTVVDGSLATAISKLRKALGPDGDEIVTLPRVGYRLSAAVRHQGVRPPSASGPALTEGDEVPHRPGWRLVRRLGRPSSEAWVGQHAKTRELRVFKFADAATRRQALQREVTVARLLRDTLGERPEFVRVLEWDFDVVPARVESVYVGPSLVAWAEGQGGLAAIPLPVRLDIVIQVADAVHAAHGVDLLHKDLTPANVLVSQVEADRVRVAVADFGSASLLSPERLAALGITNLGFIPDVAQAAPVGTAMYVAPEVLLGQAPTRAADVYALGVLLYQMVAGDVRKPLAPGWEADVDDPRLREDIGAAAAGDPARRLASAGALADRLRALERRPHVAPVAASAPAARGVRAWRLALAAGLAAAVFGMTAFLSSRRPDVPAAVAVRPEVVSSVAVLPLANLSGDQGDDYLADGLTEALISDLSRLGSLRVISRTTSMAYRRSARPLPEIARELHVDGIVEGGVAVAGQRVTISAQLIHAASDTSIWSDRFEGERPAIADLQRAVSRALVGALSRDDGTSTRAPQHVTAAPAYDAYLRGRYFWNRRTRDDLLKAVEYFQRAATLDPDYALAHAGLADAYVELVGFGNLEPEAGLAQAKASAARAIALEPQQPEGHAAQAYALAAGWEWRAADQAFRRALEANPTYVVALYQYGFFLSMVGRQDEAIALVERALASDPLSPIVRYRAGRVFYHARRFADAHVQFAKILELDPADPLGAYGQGLVFAAEGRYDDALRHLERQPLERGFDAAAVTAAAGHPGEARRRLSEGLRRHAQGRDYLRPGWVAEVHAALGDTDEAMRWLERGYAEHDAWLALLKVWPPFDPLRGDARFQALLTKLDFPQ